MYDQRSSCENTYGGMVLGIAIIFDQKQSKEQKKKVIASTNVRFSAQIQVKSKKIKSLPPLMSNFRRKFK